MKHTNGPWNYEIDNDNFVGFYSVKSIKDKGTLAYRINREANAKLIASAPELLDTLIQIKNALVDADNFDETTTKIYQLINKTIDPLQDHD